ncbi:MAG: phage terminase large subunit [Candidatus Shapirobacteria bacterium]|jgi:PBSX family phage terminase large subunit
MEFTPLDVYEPLYFTPDSVRYISACGGRGGGRSHNCSEYFIFKITRPQYFRGLIARAVFSDLKLTTWLEFCDRIFDNESLNQADFHINNTEKIITYKPTGNTITGIGFRKSSSQRKASLKGFANVTDVLIEEAQELNEAELNQLDDSLRTIKAPIKIIFAYNMPEKTHILMKRFFDLEPVELEDGNGIIHEGFMKAIPKPSRPDHIMIFSSYLENYKHLDIHTIANYERYFYDNPEHYFSEILGYVSGGAKGVIFKYNINWFEYSELPDIDLYETYGLDFGGGGVNEKRKCYPELMVFDEPDGSSTTVLVRLLINKASMSCYVKLLLYKAYISPDDLSKVCKEYCTESDGKYIKKKNILADNARADKIRDLLNDGLSVIGAKTKEGSSNKVTSGIDIIKKYKIFIHKDDIPAIVEANNFRWDVTASGELTGNVADKFKDFWDAVRYALVNYELYSW